VTLHPFEANGLDTQNHGSGRGIPGSLSWPIAITRWLGEPLLRVAVSIASAANLRTENCVDPGKRLQAR